LHAVEVHESAAPQLETHQRKDRITAVYATGPVGRNQSAYGRRIKEPPTPHSATSQRVIYYRAQFCP
jgi:hypothetical protein